MRQHIYAHLADEARPFCMAVRGGLMLPCGACMTSSAISSSTARELAGNWARDLAVLTLLCVIFLGCVLGVRPLSVPDESRYAEIPREMVATGDYLTPRLNGVKYFEKPPLVYWLEA